MSLDISIYSLQLRKLGEDYFYQQISRADYLAQRKQIFDTIQQDLNIEDDGSDEETDDGLHTTFQDKLDSVIHAGPDPTLNDADDITTLYSPDDLPETDEPIEAVDINDVLNMTNEPELEPEYDSDTETVPDRTSEASEADQAGEADEAEKKTGTSAAKIGELVDTLTTLLKK